MPTSRIALAGAILVTIAGTTLAAAESRTTVVDKRQATQQRRIDKGVASGQITPQEAARLQKGQAHVQRLEDKAKSDGTVTPRERRRLQHAQDAQSRRIHRQRHDAQTQSRP
jgi:hypothetical protein